MSGNLLYPRASIFACKSEISSVEQSRQIKKFNKNKRREEKRRFFKHHNYLLKNKFQFYYKTKKCACQVGELPHQKSILK